MITNILDQNFADFASKVENIEKKVVPQRQRLDILADYYTNRVSANETELIEQYAEKLVSGGQPHTPDPRLYMRRDLLGLVQDAYALGTADALDDLKDVQFFDKKTSAEFALSPDDKLQRDIQKLQRDIQASQQIVRQTKTLNQYTNTLQALQQQAQTLNNTEAIERLNRLSEELQRLKIDSNIRSSAKLINQQLDKGQKPYDRLMQKLDQEKNDIEELRKEDPIYNDNRRLIRQRPLSVGDYATPQEYLVKRAIEEKLQYLENRRNSLADTPPIALDEDKDFFKWYAEKRLVPIANRYQIGLQDKNEEAKKIVTAYTQKLNNNTITQASKGEYTNRVINKILNIEEKVEDNIDQEEKKANKFNGSQQEKFKRDQRPIKRVQRVVATELAIAYNVGRLKAYLKAGIQYVTISTSMYSPKPCEYCLDTEKKSEDNPISIDSLLKRAYRNEGFDKDLNRPIEQRYLIHHPYCYCYYKPHPKRDPEDIQDSTGIYADPNSWKFILGAGLGVSLVFLAFALTTGRKIAPTIPRTIPTQLPARIPQAIPEIITDDVPTTIPVRAIKPTTLIGLPDLRANIENLSSDKQRIYANIVANTELPIDIRLSQLYTQAAEDGIQINTRDLRTLETTATKVQATKGAVRTFLNTNTNKLLGVYNRNKATMESRLKQEQDKINNINANSITKSDLDAITNSTKSFDKIFLDSQLKAIQKTKSIALDSFAKTEGKTKTADIRYREELQQAIDTLSSMESDLLEKQNQIKQIRSYTQQLKQSLTIIKQNRTAQIKQQIENTGYLLDTNNIQEAVQEYTDLLALLSDLPPTEIRKYQRSVQELNRRIKEAQGTNLKRFMGYTVAFSKYSI